MCMCIRTYPIAGGFEMAASFGECRFHSNAKRSLVTFVSAGG